MNAFIVEALEGLIAFKNLLLESFEMLGHLLDRLRSKV